MVNRVINKLNTINTRLDALLIPAIVGRWIDRHPFLSIMVPVAIIMVLMFILGQMVTTSIHLRQSSFHIAYSSWFDAGGCR